MHARESVGEAWGHDSAQMKQLDVMLDNVLQPWYVSLTSTYNAMASRDHDDDVRFGFVPTQVRAIVSLLIATARKLREQIATGVPQSRSPRQVARDSPKQLIDKAADKRGLSFKQLAGRLKVSAKTLDRIRRGQEVRAGTRVLVAHGLNCDPERLRWKPLKTSKMLRRKKSLI